MLIYTDNSIIQSVKYKITPSGSCLRNTISNHSLYKRQFKKNAPSFSLAPFYTWWTCLFYFIYIYLLLLIYIFNFNSQGKNKLLYHTQYLPDNVCHTHHTQLYKTDVVRYCQNTTCCQQINKMGKNNQFVFLLQYCIYAPDYLMTDKPSQPETLRVTDVHIWKRNFHMKQKEVKKYMCTHKHTHTLILTPEICSTHYRIIYSSEVNVIK